MPATPARSGAHPGAGPAHVFRPRSAVAAAIGWAIVSLVWATSAAVDGGAGGLALQAPGIGLAGAVVYAVLVRPAVEVGPAGIRLRNVLRDVDVPWAALAQVRTRYALTLVAVDGRRFAAWAAPASGRYADVSLSRHELASLAWDTREGTPPASASSETQSGAVAAWIRREWRRAEAAGAGSAGAGSASDAAIQVTPARRVIGTLVVAVVLVAVTTIL